MNKNTSITPMKSFTTNIKATEVLGVVKKPSKRISTPSSKSPQTHVSFTINKSCLSPTKSLSSRRSMNLWVTPCENELTPDEELKERRLKRILSRHHVSA